MSIEALVAVGGEAVAEAAGVAVEAGATVAEASVEGMGTGISKLGLDEFQPDNPENPQNKKNDIIFSEFDSSELGGEINEHSEKSVLECLDEIETEKPENLLKQLNNNFIDGGEIVDKTGNAKSIGESKILNEDAGKNCPVENGTWDGERGNSTWHPNKEYIPQKKNPESQTWKDILSKYDIDGIDFNEGEPDFEDISKGDVEIADFSDNRDDNFDKADIELANQKGCSPEEVEKWRKQNGYTWHECKDMKTMQKVPSEVHNNIPHRGGISEIKNGG